MGEAFWEIPVIGNKSTDDQVTWDAFGSHATDQKEPAVGEDFESRLQNFLSKNSRTESRFGLPDRTHSNAGRLEAFQLDQTFKKDALDQRRENYRNLLGLNSKQVVVPVSDLSAFNGGGQTSAGTYPSYLPTTKPSPTARNLTGNSLHPVRSSERESFYQGSSYTPQRPSVFDTIGVEAPAAPSLAPEKRVSSPFYQPPKRQF